MNSRSELSARNGEATVIILQNELNLANNKLEQVKNRVEEQNIALREIKDLCKKGIEDLTAEVARLNKDIEKAKESTQKLKSLRDIEKGKLRDIMKELDSVVKLEKALAEQFVKESLALKQYEADEACYKGLHNDVARHFSIYKT